MSLLSCSPLSDVNNEEKGVLSPTYSALVAPMERQLPYLPELVSRSNRPLTFTFSHQVHGLVY